MDVENEVTSREVNGYTVVIVIDDDGETGNPRDADNLGIMLAPGHRDHRLGDEMCAKSIPEYEHAKSMLDSFAADGNIEGFAMWVRQEYGAYVVKPLYLLDHSGLSMRTGPFGEDPGGWDSGIVGYIFDTARTRQMTGVEGADVEAALIHEVEDYDLFLRGDVYGYRIFDPEDEEVDSCWGFLGMEHVLASGIEEAQSRDAPQWVLVVGDLRTGMSVHGPYDRQDAEADMDEHEGVSTSMLLLRPPRKEFYSLIPPGPKTGSGPAVLDKVMIHLSAAGLRSHLAEGWKIAPEPESNDPF